MRYINNESIGTYKSLKEAEIRVLKRSIEEISDEAVQATLELINANDLYRGNEYKHLVEALQRMKQEYNTIPEELRNNYIWSVGSSFNSVAVNKIRNTAIGTVLQKITEGDDLDSVVAFFNNKVMAPTSFKRTATIATPKQVEAYRTELTEMGYMDSLYRRGLL